MAKPLSLKYYDGKEIPEDVLLATWNLRVSLLTLTKDKEKDWNTFKQFVTKDDAAMIAFFDQEKKVQGFFAMTYIPVDYNNKKGLLMYSKYFYFQKEYRGHYKTSLAPFAAFPRAFKRYGLRSLYFVTTSYPQSYISLSRSSGTVYSLKDNDISDWQQHALSAFVMQFFAEDWNENEGVVENQNIVDPPTFNLTGEAKSLNDKYQQQNPNWRMGKTLPIILAINHVSIFHNIKRALRRVLR